MGEALPPDPAWRSPRVGRHWGSGGRLGPRLEPSCRALGRGGWSCGSQKPPRVWQGASRPCVQSPSSHGAHAPALWPRRTRSPPPCGWQAGAGSGARGRVGGRWRLGVRPPTPGSPLLGQARPLSLSVLHRLVVFVTFGEAGRRPRAADVCEYCAPSWRPE